MKPRSNQDDVGDANAADELVHLLDDDTCSCILIK